MSFDLWVQSIQSVAYCNPIPSDIGAPDIPIAVKQEKDEDQDDDDEASFDFGRIEWLEDGKVLNKSEN